MPLGIMFLPYVIRSRTHIYEVIIYMKFWSTYVCARKAGKCACQRPGPGPGRRLSLADAGPTYGLAL